MIYWSLECDLPLVVPYASKLGVARNSRNAKGCTLMYLTIIHIIESE
jgi:hypothetical protein